MAVWRIPQGPICPCSGKAATNQLARATCWSSPRGLSLLTTTHSKLPSVC